MSHGFGGPKTKDFPASLSKWHRRLVILRKGLDAIDLCVSKRASVPIALWLRARGAMQGWHETRKSLIDGSISDFGHPDLESLGKIELLPLPQILGFHHRAWSLSVEPRLRLLIPLQVRIPEGCAHREDDAVVIGIPLVPISR